MFGELRDEFSKICEAQDAQIAELKNEVSVLKKHVDTLEEKIEENDNYERRDTLVFSGSAIPGIQTTEVCSELVTGLIKNILKINISPGDISTSHRMNTRRNSTNQDIIAKFCRRNLKTDILNACRKTKPSNFFVNEFLTPQRQTIAYVLRRCKREFPNIVSGSSTFEGKVFVWVKPPNPSARGAKDLRMPINSYSRLVEFCEKTLQQPLSHFIAEWKH